MSHHVSSSFTSASAAAAGRGGHRAPASPLHQATPLAPADPGPSRPAKRARPSGADDVDMGAPLAGNSSMSDFARRTAHVDSVAELLNAVPRTYREVLRKPLALLVDAASKRASAALTLATLRRQQASGDSWPASCLGLHEPKFATSDMFAATQPAAITELHNNWVGWRASALESGIAIKKAEVEWFDKQLDLRSVSSTLINTVTEHWTTVVEPTHRAAEFGTLEDGEIDTNSIRWTSNPDLAREYREFLHDVSTLASRILMIENNREVRLETLRFKKMKLRDDAKNAMDDADDITAKVKSAVQEALKGLDIKVFRPYLNVLYAADDFLGKRKRDSSQKEVVRALRQKERHGTFATETTRQEADEIEWWCEGQRKGKGELIRLVNIVRNSEFTYFNYVQYPNALLDLPFCVAARLINERAPPAYIQAQRFRAFVHIQPGLDVPPQIQRDFSVGMKYLFRQPVDHKLVLDAYEDFCERLRWRVFFHETESDRSYDPDYDVPHKTPPCKKRFAYVEAGLSAGQSYVANFCASRDSKPETGKGTAAFLGGPNPRALRRWLTDSRCIATGTDKNLGCAIVSEEWYMNGCRKHLSSDSYRLLDTNEAFMALERLTDIIRGIAEDCENRQIAKFLVSKCPSIGKDGIWVDGSWHVPRFYGIPKIHKNPPTIRPIVPCHSAISGPFAKVISKLLKPIVEAQPFVINSSKEFVSRLSNLTLSPYSKYYLLSGDIVAYYPNIPPVECADIISSMWIDFYGNSRIEDERLLLLGLKHAFTGLIFQFEGSFYRQEKGISMGVACAPDAANLFGAYHENKVVPHLLEANLVFYGRYMDDTFAIVQANDTDTALATVNHIDIGGLELNWNCDDTSMTFLDVNVFFDSGNTIHWTPFRKARNSLERIPWISHHPFDVKRGTFIGELSRIATLCSSPQYYVIESYYLACLYVARGYPINLVKKWLQKYMQSRWELRFTTRGEGSEVPGLFVLKSYFNEVWDLFSIHELAKVIKDAWLDGLTTLDSGRAPAKTPDIREMRFFENRWLVSRKRTANLADVCSQVRASFQSFVEDKDFRAEGVDSLWV
jgi:hypothetical protein